MVSAMPLIFSRPQFPCELHTSRIEECPVQVPSGKPSGAGGALGPRPGLYQLIWDAFAVPRWCLTGVAGGAASP